MKVAEISSELQALQKQRAWYIKSKNMVSNRLQATVAGTLGYSSGMSENDRKKLFGEAGNKIKQVVKGEDESEISSLILTTWNAIEGFEAMKNQLEKEMTRLAKSLPVAKWVEKPAQRGFGILFLAIVIGESGDLDNYPNPAKLWKRLGCAPYTFQGKTKMGSTWRYGKEGKLPAEAWEDFGYSPRRRSIAYLIGEGIVKQNGTGPYRKRYESAKKKIAKKNKDYSKMRCHRHGMLLATKLLLKNLWIEWRK